MPTARGVRNALDRAGRRVILDHPGPSTVALQRAVMLVLLDVAFTGYRMGRRLWPR